MARKIVEYFLEYIVEASPPFMYVTAEGDKPGEELTRMPYRLFEEAGVLGENEEFMYEVFRKDGECVCRVVPTGGGMISGEEIEEEIINNPVLNDMKTLQEKVLEERLSRKKK